ncbi:MAG: hypothetical protein GX800_07745, partial [Clostridiaceae bacterium]|nr:hypothetical protein [Clostridiaceae bacterium]
MRGNLSKKKGGGGGDVSGSIGYIIAPPNATAEDKKKADLVLDDVNGSPHTQLADMVDMLHDRRSQNTDIAIVIEFCPGIIELPYDTNWEIPETKGNIYIYGNGVRITGDVGGGNGILHVQGEDCKLSDIYT